MLSTRRPVTKGAAKASRGLNNLKQFWSIDRRTSLMTLLTAQHIVVIQHKDKVIFLDTNNCSKSCLGRIYPKLSRLDNWIKLLLRLPSFGEQRGGMGPFVGVVSFNRAVRAHTIERQKNKDSWLCVKKGTGLLLKPGQYFVGPKAQINSVFLFIPKDFSLMF